VLCGAAQWSGQCRSWVIFDVLSAFEPLPLFSQLQTYRSSYLRSSSDSLAMFETAGEFKLEAIGEPNREVEYGYVLLGLRK
jgi:hypothetical protein